MESLAGSAWAAEETDCKTAADFFPKKRKLPPIFLERGPWEDRGPGQKKKEKTDTVRRVGEPLAPRALQPDSNINTLYIYTRKVSVLCYGHLNIYNAIHKIFNKIISYESNADKS
jgi:hypothetical protein